MATLKLFLDKRYKYKSGYFPLRVAVNHRGRSAFINIGIELLQEQWDANKLKIVKHPQKVVLMTFATQRLMAYQTVLYKLIESGRVRSMDATFSTSLISIPSSSLSSCFSCSCVIFSEILVSDCKGTDFLAIILAKSDFLL